MMDAFRRMTATVSLEEVIKTLLALNEKVEMLELKVTKLESELEDFQDRVNKVGNYREYDR